MNKAYSEMILEQLLITEGMEKNVVDRQLQFKYDDRQNQSLTETINFMEDRFDRGFIVIALKNMVEMGYIVITHCLHHTFNTNILIFN